MTTAPAPFLGLCLIVRDGEETLPALLDSIEGAFDEIVIVDTGSQDRTRGMVLKWAKAHGVVWGPGGPKTEEGVFTDGTRVVLSTFVWIDDFAAARNYAFGLGTATWRGYLDADDVLPNAKNLRPTIRRTEQVSPKSNVIVLPYDYAHGEIVQDKLRFVRWADGWRWVNEIHEEIVRDPPGPRFHSRYADLVVRHGYTAEQTRRSVERNARICAAVREKALAAGDGHKAALMAYYLGLYETLPGGDADAAIRWLSEAEAQLGDTQIAADARIHLARFHLVLGNLEAAATWAAAAVGRTPEIPDAWAMKTIVDAERGAHGAAVAAFTRLTSTPPPPFVSSHDAVISEGLAPVSAATSYLTLGDAAAALSALGRVPPALQGAPKVAAGFREAHVAAMKRLGVERLVGLVEYLLADTEPEKALAVIERAPAAISDSPEVGRLRRQIEAKLHHLDGWDAYRAAYGSIPEDTYHTADDAAAGVRNLGRAVRVREWATGLAAEGPPVRVLSIGAQDCLIEAAMMEASGRIQITVCDVAPQASKGIAMLAERFPGRVVGHKIERDHYDWAPVGASFDAILIFEVVEHLPDDDTALAMLRSYLTPGGRLFLSTPVADRWVEPYLAGGITRPDDGVPLPAPPWFGHVRAHNPTTLRALLSRRGFTGRVDVTEQRSVFLVEVTGRAAGARVPVSIFVPGTPHPFGPDSHLRGHLGGSEEAVLYLAPALQAVGAEMTIYSPRPADATHVVRDGVLWRDAADFDFGGEHGAVLFWRCPEVLLHPEVKAAGYRKILWLHDTHYGAPAEAYKAADAVVVLSAFHKRILCEREGLDVNAIRFAVASNGIDLALYPPVTGEEDRGHRVVYGSSPDRGLDRLLGAWPAVRAAVPDATLDVFYTWDLLDRMRPAEAARLRKLADGAAPLGVTVRGGVDHATLAAAYRAAAVWAYPTGFEEISCITAMKAQAAGAWPVVTRFAALPETVIGGTFVRPDADAATIAEAIATALVGGPGAAARRSLAAGAAEKYGWKRVAARFMEIVRGG